MARYIDADKMREDWLYNGENEYIYDTNAVLDSIDSQPTADVEEVVHCVDCEYLMFSDMYGECRKAHLGIVSPHDFCSRGQRRREG